MTPSEISDRFKNLMEKSVPSKFECNLRPGHFFKSQDIVEIAYPLYAFAASLSIRDGYINTIVDRSDDGVVYTIRFMDYRFKRRYDKILEVRVEGNRGAVLVEPTFEFEKQEQLADWLEEFIQSTTLQDLLAAQRAEMKKDVEVKLVVKHGISIPITMSRRLLDKLYEFPIGMDYEFKFGFDESEPLPNLEDLTGFDAAGVHFIIAPETASLIDRIVRFTGVKLP